MTGHMKMEHKILCLHLIIMRYDFRISLLVSVSLKTPLLFEQFRVNSNSAFERIIKNWNVEVICHHTVSWAMLSNICFCTFINSSALSILLLGSEACKLFCFLQAVMAQDGVSSLHAVLSSRVWFVDRVMEAWRDLI